ncbi:hypothetical protein BBK82_26030 [Lentzea guizhouensis]|uniref:Uncharacterized protein n=1 Tax=Lentzea guizhouensis TaxID=1586287 RepID=A0A1B2HMT6_9PSEU|nr:hypothetical protein BBK82_26030 [Lentzea guizhouensis]
MTGWVVRRVGWCGGGPGLRGGGLGGAAAGRSSHTWPISSPSSVIAATDDHGPAGSGARVPPGDIRTTFPVLCNRMPATHSASPADARASAGRSTRRRIRVS